MEEKQKEKPGVSYFVTESGKDHKTTAKQEHVLIAVDRKQKNVTFGEFPQTIKSENVTILENTKDVRGFFRFGW